MLTPHYRLAYIPTGSYSGGNGQRVINDQRDTIIKTKTSKTSILHVLCQINDD
jgi:hypothetical protein